MVAHSTQEQVNQALVAGKPDFQGIFNHQRQQMCGGSGAINGTVKTRRYQVWQTTNMVDVDMRDDQCAHRFEIKLDSLGRIIRCIQFTGLRSHLRTF